jgi:beta-lactamase regulating signal transducer with metallopeptidase domain
MEITALLILLLPLMRRGLEGLGAEHLSLGRLTEAGSNGDGFEQGWMTGFGMVWVAGAMIGLGLLMRRLTAVWRLQKNSKRVPQHIARRIADELHLPLKVVENRFRLSREMETPVVALGWPSTVLLPEAWSDWPQRLQLSAMRHEWHHVLSGDAWWSCGMRMFCMALWFHPLAWHLASRWADECEHLADCAAVRGGDPADYAGDLLGLAGRAATPMMTWQGVPGFLGPRNSRLHRRVRALLDGRGGSRPYQAWLSLGGLVLLLVLAGSCAWSGVRPAPAEVVEEGMMEEVQLRLAADAFPGE